ncbi:hypothetical protein [Nocardioides campestrisoli]|uniref:hypothetical protein n=1 Tax=Nocardioides campestrisoli TaxID=2736757 RepID=UPI00163D8425|nr:hypothetical protein [Nocardioides campestrisoli]
MSELTWLLQQVREGQVAVEDAAPRIARLVSTVADGRHGCERLCPFEVIQLKMEGALDDPADSFSQVEIAHVVGELTDEQYAAIRVAVVRGAFDVWRRTPD